jgi:chemotaxis protein methyltransferase CheR
MDKPSFPAWAAKPMSQAEFGRFSEFISSQSGIKMPPSKKIMLEARLQKRLRALGIRTFGEYYAYLHGDEGGSELVHMLDVVTTNKTDFFREPAHFQYLAETVLPEFLEERGRSGRADRPFHVWSAGCSSGEEPYTLAMVLAEFAGRHPAFRFAVTATDLSTRVLERARTAIYDADRVAAVPPALKHAYLLRSRDRSRNQVRIVPELRAAVEFRRLNLIEDRFDFSGPLDAIFCRNVIIYFDRATQEQLLNRLCGALQPRGYLFLGHSESIHGLSLPLRRIVSTVHRRID